MRKPAMMESYEERYRREFPPGDGHGDGDGNDDVNDVGGSPAKRTRGGGIYNFDYKCSFIHFCF